jgi:hypothetical protein
VKSILRSLLVCCLLLALPFQAFASASMRPLAAGSGSASAASAHLHAPTAAQLPPCHRQTAMSASMDTRAQGTHDSHGCHAGHQARSKCGSCAACCAGAAMASGAGTTLAPAPPRFVSIPFRAGYLPSVDPVLPDRPPSILPA